MTSLTTINSRCWVIAGAILVAVVGGACLLLFIRASGWRARQGGDHHPATRSSNELATSRHEALAAIKNGRFDLAFGFYRALPASAWEVGDCLQLGETLIENDRVVLGWAALEAARRIDPKHAASASALDALQAKLALATGRERGMLHEAASRGELLRRSRTGLRWAYLFSVWRSMHRTRTPRTNSWIDSTVTTKWYFGGWIQLPARSS